MTALAHHSPSESLAGRLTSNRHCVFRSGSSWFSMPAVTIREVLVAPATVRLPESPSWLVGIVHIQSEFIPVISLEKLLKQSYPAGSEGNERLLVMAGSPVWSLLVSQVQSLTDIEATLSPENYGQFGQASCTVGTFMLGEKIAHVLEPHRILRKVQQGLSECWRSGTHLWPSSAAEFQIQIDDQSSAE
jgi:chemotaxis signal transduction protein